MASYLRPRRGKLATAKSTFNTAANTLKSGEVFFEYPSSAGAGQGRIMMGDGSNTYTTLSTYNSTYGTSKYFLDPDSMTVAVSANSGTNEDTLLGMISGSYSLAKVLGAIKQLLSLHKSAITSLNNDIAFFIKNSWNCKYLGYNDSRYKYMIYYSANITNLAVNTAHGSACYYASQSVNLPVTVTHAAVCVSAHSNGNGIIWATLTNSDTTKVNYRILSPLSGTYNGATHIIAMIHCASKIS